MPEVKPKKLRKYTAGVLAKMKDGAVLCCEVVQAEGATPAQGRRWFLEPGGKSVGPVAAVELINRGLVEPNVGGLFHVTDAQSYQAVAP